MEKHTIMLHVKRDPDDPNKTEMCVQEIDGCTVKFSAFHGFTAEDIYKLIKGDQNELS